MITDPLVLVLWMEYEQSNRKANDWYSTHGSVVAKA